MTHCPKSLSTRIRGQKFFPRILHLGIRYFKKVYAFQVQKSGEPYFTIVINFSLKLIEN